MLGIEFDVEVPNFFDSPRTIPTAIGKNAVAEEAIVPTDMIPIFRWNFIEFDQMVVGTLPRYQSLEGHCINLPTAETFQQ